jgi:hypothetical protein
MPVDGVHVAWRTADAAALPANGCCPVPTRLPAEQRLRFSVRRRCPDTYLRARKPTRIREGQPQP